MQYPLFKNSSHRWLTKLTITLAIASGVNTALFAMPRDSLAPLSQAIAAETIELSAEAQKLVGTWQLTTPNNESGPYTMVFTPDGKLYLIHPTRKIGVSAEYQINSLNGETYLDVFQGSFGSRTTFSFNSKGQLILQQLFMPAAMQYANYSGNVPNIVGVVLMPNMFRLTRVSTDSKLDANIEFPSSYSPAALARQSEAKTYIGAINRGHQAFFLEKEYFTNKLNDLGLGIGDESNNYKYQIVVLDSKKAVQSIALAKEDNLKSYMGLVYITKLPEMKEDISLSLICESQKPTRKMPPKFKLTSNPTCPEGYIELSRQ
jgi:hypothetical protein